MAISRPSALLRLILMWIACGAAGCATSPPPPASRMVEPANATSLVQTIANAKPGDTIRVAAGTYALSEPLRLTTKGDVDHPIRFESVGPGRAVLDFAAEAEVKVNAGVAITGDYWQLTGIEVAHAGSYGFNITGSHNGLLHCVSRENRNSGTQIEAGGSYNVIDDCESFRNFDLKTKGEDADGFTAKHSVGPGNVFRHCRSYQNADDGWDLWMSPNPIVVEDCVSFRNGYNIWNFPDFQGDGNGFKFGGNYVATAHIARRCVSIENPLHGFDQNHNIGPLTLEDCVAIRCGKGFCFPELPRQGKVILRRCTSFGCVNVLEPEVVTEECRWYADIPTGTLGPPPRPGHRNVKGAGDVPTTEPTPMYLPQGAPLWGRPSDTPATQPYPEP
ncbi:MAG TPA: right-handed parallel beta-helix repeat-containing protein [Tepidisphaeraceae bacterium]|nr:right-handed parallel beta-helix repeat-containing protein [Tepidisphaeraceae bacterium]